MVKKVLVVEDNLINQELLSEILERLECSADVADNGKIAVARVETNQYDLILMDLQMPEMDGIEATEAIRKINKTVPIVAITASLLHTDHDKCAQVGMNGTLTKPYTFDQVKGILAKFLGT